LDLTLIEFEVLSPVGQASPAADNTFTDNEV